MGEKWATQARLGFQGKTKKRKGKETRGPQEMAYTDLHSFQIQISNGRSQRSNFSHFARCTLMRDRHLYIHIILCFSCPIHSSSIHQKFKFTFFNLESASSRCCNGLSQPYQERTPNSLQEEQDPRKHYQCCNGRCSQSS